MKECMCGKTQNMVNCPVHEKKPHENYWTEKEQNETDVDEENQ